MGNREYNELFDELVELEESTGIILSNSPTQRAGYKIVSTLPKVKHDIPLLSLGKSKKISDLETWLGNNEGILMLKIDGGTGKVEYKNKLFNQLSTRGDSETNIGEDISHNINSIKGIPLKIDDDNDIQVVGENHMTFKSFNTVNDSILLEKDKYKHPRNLANGSVGLLDSKVCKERNIEFCAFNIIKGNKFKTKAEQFEWLKGQGFNTVKYWIVTKNDLQETIEQIIEDIPNIEIPIDGLVLSFNNIEYGLSKGSSNHHPNHSISFKFEDSWYDTNYNYTEWNTSRTGKIVPKGIFTSIKMDGADHDRATLHNLDRFRAMKLGHGDFIQTSKRNKIIPAIENNITRSNTEVIPTKCPACGGDIEERLLVNTHDLYCLNPDCDAKLLKKLKHFVSKQCFNISDIGETTLETLIDKGFLENYIDIFKLSRFKKEILSLDGFAEKSYIKMLEAIENSKNIEMSSLITSLGIKNVGFGTSKRIAKYFNNDISKFINSTKYPMSFASIEDCGEITSLSIYEYFKNEENMNLFNELLELITIKQEEKKSDSKLKDLAGLTFVITGSVTTFKNRDEFKELVESLNGKVAGGVSSKTNYLVNNDVTSTSGKNKTAKDLNVEIISEQQFNEMIGRS
jgi:DNA ligase (NAD+)